MWSCLLCRTLYKLQKSHENKHPSRKKRKGSKNAEEKKTILYGTWYSPFAKTVEIALKAKGIPYENVEEDLGNKSAMLLKLNPIHEKVPVLVHNGKAIVESLLIIEYIDETWKTSPQLLPEDPYERSQGRFWSGYVHQIFETLTQVAVTSGEAQEKALKEMFEQLEKLEEGLKCVFPNGIASSTSDEFINGRLLELVIFSCFGIYQACIQEVLGINVTDPKKTPLLFSCIAALMEIPVVKASCVASEKMVALAKAFREDALKSPGGYHV